MQRIEIKIIISVIVFTLAIVALERYQLLENITEQFRDAKKSKNYLLLDTISPIVSLNLSLGLDGANKDYLNQIAEQNDDLDFIRLTDLNNNIIYTYTKKDNFVLNNTSINYIKKYTLDYVSLDKIALIELSFSDLDYEEMLSKNNNIAFNTFMVTIFLLSIFIFLIKLEFRHLEKLTQNVLVYDPSKNNFPLEKSNKKDEVGFIHNAIVAMVLKINAHAKLLDEANISLEEKVKIRTVELEIQKEKAEASVKSKSNFLANMSHEIRTPMNGIIGMSHLLEQTQLNYKQKNYTSKIRAAADNLLSLINDILDFSKIEAGKLKLEHRYFDMKTVIDNVKNIIEYKAKEKGLAFNVIYTEKDSVFYGDSLRIGQILINLLSNAIKFTNIGNVNLIVESLNKNIVRFIVKDTGVGLSKKQSEHLFEAFSQADESTTRKYGGTGLGLSICKELVELMHGKIFVESEIKKWSKFTFEIELLSGTHEDIKFIKNEESLERLTNSLTSLNGSCILLVEDNYTNQDVIVGLLEHSGIKIDIADNGQDAIVMSDKKDYELILMDIQMKGMDGYQSTLKIRQKNKEVPIIALTSNAMKEDVLKSKSVGMNEHLSKPVDIKKLYETLLKYISKKEESIIQNDLKVIGSINSSKLELSSKKRDALFAKLLSVARTKFPKKCEPVIEQISKYKLSKEDAETFSSVKTLLKTYRFKEIITLMERVCK